MRKTRVSITSCHPMERSRHKNKGSKRLSFKSNMQQLPLWTKDEFLTSVLQKARKVESEGLQAQIEDDGRWQTA